MTTYTVTITSKYPAAGDTPGTLEIEARTAAEAIKKARWHMHNVAGYLKSDGPFYYKATKGGGVTPMFDFAQPNQEPGQICRKCSGTGEYRWGAVVNGKQRHGGTCFSCSGTGKQSAEQISRNKAYNRYKLARLDQESGS